MDDRKHKKRKEEIDAYEDALQRALQDLRSDVDRSIGTAARCHKVSRTTLQDRHLGRTKSKNGLHPEDQLLVGEEERLMKWIEEWDDMGMRPRARHVISMWWCDSR